MFVFRNSSGLNFYHSRKFFSEWRSVNGFFSPFYDVKKSFVLSSLADRIKNRKNLRYLFIKIIKPRNYIFYGCT